MLGPPRPALLPIKGLAMTSFATRAGWRAANPIEKSLPIAQPATCTGPVIFSASSRPARSATTPSKVSSRTFSENPKPRWS